MNAVFVDTGYLLALEIGNDQHHRAAMQHWQGVVSALPPLVTTSYVFDAVASRVQHAGVPANRDPVAGTAYMVMLGVYTIMPLLMARR